MLRELAEIKRLVGEPALPLLGVLAPGLRTPGPSLITLSLLSIYPAFITHQDSLELTFELGDGRLLSRHRFPLVEPKEWQ